MSPRYMNALSEVDFVTNNLETEIKNKIPEKFRVFVEKNKSKEEKSVDTKNLQEETYAILAIIYRKFIASEEERKEIEADYNIRLKKEKEALRETEYKKIDFSCKVIKSDNPNRTTLPIESPKEKWYIKLLKKIKNIFVKK